MDRTDKSQGPPKGDQNPNPKQDDRSPKPTPGEYQNPGTPAGGNTPGSYQDEKPGSGNRTDDLELPARQNDQDQDFENNPDSRPEPQDGADASVDSSSAR